MMLIGGLLGLVIGAVLGLTGAGGGIFAVPALVFGLGMDMRAAAPLALMAVGSAAMLGALQGLRQGLVRYKAAIVLATAGTIRSEEHTSELQSLMRISYAVFCLKKKQ